MKRCSYCGAEYPDDAVACAIDQTPFGDVPAHTPSDAPPSEPFEFPAFGVFSERKIPVSLTLVSYWFFLTGAASFAAIGFLAFFLVFASANFAGDHILVSSLVGGALAVLAISCLLIFPVTMVVFYVIFAICFIVFESSTGGSSTAMLSRLVGGAVAILSVYISRGLRVGSRGWRTCALVFIWWEFAFTAFGIVQHFLPQGHHQREWTGMDWLGYAFAVAVLAWQYRVLTRSDVRDLFGV